MTQIYANNFTTLVLGRRGENLSRKVIFDIRDLESLYGTGDVEVIYQRPGDAQPYPLAVQREGTLITWDVTSTDTEMSDGSGKCELRYYVGEVLAKSKTWQTWVEPAMDTPSETAPPEPEQGWVDQVLTTRIAAEKAAADAKADADRAAALAAQAAEKATQTAQNASDAAKAMDAAQTAQRLGEEAQGAAKVSEDNAAGSASAAEQSAQKAEKSAAVYDDVVADVNQLKQDLSAEQAAREQADTSLQQEVSGKLPKSPANWGPWTADEQAAARERLGIDNEFVRVFQQTNMNWGEETSLIIDVNDLSHFIICILIEGADSYVSEYGLISLTGKNGDFYYGVFELGNATGPNKTAFCRYDINDMPKMTKFSGTGGNPNFTIRGAYSKGIANESKNLPNYKVKKIHFPPMKGTVSISVLGC